MKPRLNTFVNLYWRFFLHLESTNIRYLFQAGNLDIESPDSAPNWLRFKITITNGVSVVGPENISRINANTGSVFFGRDSIFYSNVRMLF